MNKFKVVVSPVRGKWLATDIQTNEILAKEELASDVTIRVLADNGWVEPWEIMYQDVDRVQKKSFVYKPKEHRQRGGNKRKW